MFVVDTHCDSICTLDSGAECLVNPYNMAAQHLQFAAMFTERPGVSPEEAWAQMCHMRQQLKEQAVRFADRLALCRTVAEACAAVAAAVESGLCKKDTDITVKLRGGDLVVNYNDDRVLLSGDTNLVYVGELEF